METMKELSELSEPIKHINGLGEVRWQPATKGRTLQDGPFGEVWTTNYRHGSPVLYRSYWWAKRRGRKRAEVEARSTWKRVV